MVVQASHCANGSTTWVRTKRVCGDDLPPSLSREREREACEGENGTERKGNRATSLPYSPDDRTLIDLLSSSHAPHLAGYIRDGDDSEMNRLTPTMICGIVRSSGVWSSDGLLADFAASGFRVVLSQFLNTENRVSRFSYP